MGSDSVGATGRGSEEYFTDECDTCKQDGIRKKAVVYCPTCEEKMCNQCLEWHKKLKATKSHAVQPATIGMDQKATSQNPNSTMETIATICSCNQKCEVSEFCKDHQELICSTCASVKHRACKISTIDEMSRSESVVQTFSSMCERIGDLASKALEMKSQQGSCINGLQEVETRCETEIRNFKADIISWIDKLETDALADLHSTIADQKLILQRAGDSAGNALRLLTVDQKLIANADKSQNKRQMFISNIQIEKSLQHYETALSEAGSKLNVPNIEFEKNKKLSVILQESIYLGQMKTQESEYKRGKEKETFLGLHAINFTSVNIKQPEDQNVPTVTQTAFLHNGDLLIADRKNSRLTLLDPAFKVKESIKCSGQLWDIAVINDREVAATLQSGQMLQFYNVSPKLQAGRNIKLDGSAQCWSVAITKDCIYVSRSTPDILVLDTNGKTLRSIIPAQMGIHFQSLSYIAINCSGNKLYYSDCWDNKLICMTTVGKHVFTYTDPDLKSPRGLIVDDDDNVLIASEG